MHIINALQNYFYRKRCEKHLSVIEHNIKMLSVQFSNITTSLYNLKQKIEELKTSKKG